MVRKILEATIKELYAIHTENKNRIQKIRRKNGNN